MKHAELVESTVVDRICACRDAALARMDEAIAARVESERLAAEAAGLAHQAHGTSSFRFEDRRTQDACKVMFDKIDADRVRESYRKFVDASTWKELVSLTGMNHLMDRTAKEKLDRDLNGDVPEVTVENVRATLESLSGDAHLIFQRGLARAFSDLDRRFKSHDAFQIGDRIILTHVFDQWGSFAYGNRQADTLLDLERVFAVLDGNPTGWGSIVYKIRESRGGGLDPRQSVTESTYMRIKGYKNGNAHLWFTRDDLVQKANLVLAEYFGEVLPDAVPGAKEADADLKTSGALSRDLAFYPTPIELARKVVGDLHLGHLNRHYPDLGIRVLEPSAGVGDLLAPLVAEGVPVDAIEVDPDRANQMRGRFPGINVRTANFLMVEPTPIYSHVVMNPPFARTHWIEHITHAVGFLKPRGTLVAILPVTADIGESSRHVEFRSWLDRVTGRGRSPGHWNFTDLPPESFAASGTRINTVTLKIVLP